MSDDDTPDAAAPAVPEASSKWSDQDRRTLYITIGGTLAANVATVIIAGAALAVVRTGSSTYNLGVVLLNTILGVLSLALGVRVRRKGEFFGLETGPGIGWLLIALSALLLLIAVLVVVGLAAGVK